MAGLITNAPHAVDPTGKSVSGDGLPAASVFALPAEVRVH